MLKLMLLKKSLETDLHNKYCEHRLLKNKFNKSIIIKNNHKYSLLTFYFLRNSAKNIQKVVLHYESS